MYLVEIDVNHSLKTSNPFETLEDAHNFVIQLINNVPLIKVAIVDAETKVQLHFEHNIPWL